MFIITKWRFLIGKQEKRKGHYQNIFASEPMQKMFLSLQEIESIALKNNIKIAIENLFPKDNNINYSIMCSDKDIFDYLDSIKDKNDFGLLLDLGHLAISANYLNFNIDDFITELLDKYSNKIFELHLSGNDGYSDQHKKLAMNSPQIKIAKKIITKVDIPVTLECRNISEDEAFEQFEQISNELYKR